MLVRLLGFIISNLSGLYNFRLDDRRYAYFVQTYIVDSLVELMDTGKNHLFTKLFLLTANAFLEVKHEEHRSRGNTLNIITFHLSPDRYLLPLREKLIKNLSILIREPEYKFHVLEQVRKYVNHIIYEGKEMAEADLPFFRDYFVANLDREDISHCLVMQDYCEHLESLELDVPIKWKEEFSNDILKLSNLLLEDRHERRVLEMGYEEYNLYRHQCMVEYFSGTTFEHFREFIRACVILNQALSGRDRDYLLKNGIAMSLQALADVAPSMFSSFITLYLEYDDIFEIRPDSIISNLFKLLSSKDVWVLINTKDYRRKNYWVSTYFALLPEEDISQEEVDSFIEHVKNTPGNELIEWLDFLVKYQRVDSGIYPKIAKVLVDKSKDDQNYARPLGEWFNSHSEIFGNWFDVFKSDEEIVFDAYLAALNIERHWDFSGEALKLLTERNFEFLFRVVDQIYEKGRWPNLRTNMPKFDFLWERDSYLEDIEHFGKYILKKNESSYRYRENIFCKLFTKENGKVELDELVSKKQTFFRSTVQNNAHDVYYMRFIFSAAQSLDEEFRRELLGLFIRWNNNFTDFETLDYELATKIGWGSQVPILEREKNFLVSLLPIFNSIELLEHKAYVEKQIENKMKSIEHEKKRDFLESSY